MLLSMLLHEKNHVVPTSWQDEALAHHGTRERRLSGLLAVRSTRASWAQGGGSGNAAVMLLQGTRDEDRRSVPEDAKKQKAGNPQLGS